MREREKKTTHYFPTHHLRNVNAGRPNCNRLAKRNTVHERCSIEQEEEAKSGRF